MNHNNVIAFYLSHDSNVAIRIGAEYRVYELERLTQQRYYNLNIDPNWKEILHKLKEIIIKDYGKINFETGYHCDLEEDKKQFLQQLFDIKQWCFVGHHLAHAACSFYQSSFQQTLIISMDGGGWDGVSEEDRVSSFNIYLADRQLGIKRLKKIDLDLGTAYGLMALPIAEIIKSDLWQDSFLAYAGKLMGLVGYGKINDSWRVPIEEFYQHPHKHLPEKLFQELGQKINLDLSLNKLSGQLAYDLVATSQYIFEQLIFESIMPILFDQEVLGTHCNICLTGGCALNVIFNTQLAIHQFDNARTGELFVPPNPSDCGLAFGMLALHDKPEEAVNIMYSGFGILDFDQLPQYIEQYQAKKVDMNEIAKLLLDGNIIGVVQDNSECGPRALGHRSILCNPSNSAIKDLLNFKIKHREWFRPFAPIIQKKLVDKYFTQTNLDIENSKINSPFMSYSPKVKDEFIGKISAVVHVDETARVQTVDQKDNPWLWDLLNCYKKIAEPSGTLPILLNTSFNIRGKPILTTIKDALEVLQTTELDYVVINNYLFSKN